MNVKDSEHQLHIVVPKTLHKEIKAIMPGHGAVTDLIRNFIKRFIFEYNISIGISTKKSPFDVATKDLADEAVMKRSQHGA